MKRVIELNVNGLTHDVMVSPEDLLIDVLRRETRSHGHQEGLRAGRLRHLHGAHRRPARAGLPDAGDRVPGQAILTIEGMEQNGVLHPIQQAFIDKGAIQCGFCTPGMVMSAKALLDEHPHPTEHEIKLGHLRATCAAAPAT